MRNITQKAIKNFLNGKRWTEKNTHTENFKLYLHGNLIAKIDDGRLFICLQGWNTVTTRERLNGLPGVKLTQKNFEPYLNGEKINSWQWYEIKNF